MLWSGSSPHARGTPPAVDSRTFASRFIPACAGNTASRANLRLASPVHPRMRGEHARAACFAIPDCGSSPHARGTLTWGQWQHHNGRFIPACAGNTCWPLSPPRTGPVHPRMRGEHEGVQDLCGGNGGSSPHARGTRDLLERPWHAHRFIPACAGNTDGDLR